MSVRFYVKNIPILLCTTPLTYFSLILRSGIAQLICLPLKFSQKLVSVSASLSKCASTMYSSDIRPSISSTTLAHATCKNIRKYTILILVNLTTPSFLFLLGNVVSMTQSVAVAFSLICSTSI